MLKSALLRALQTEIQRHDMGTFCTEEKSIAQGGNGVIVTGCPACKKRFQTTTQFIEHLTKDVLAALLDKLSTMKHDGGRTT